ncbi:MAG: hypothetical protein Q7U28_08145 [Aquabacterium sp.]|nr:hypothetical protein [Aquabacterium sp.]
MDTRTAKIDVTGKISEIKQFMPETYASIKSKSEAIGNEAFVLVRRGLRGEANCFYAFEQGRVMGTPFTLTDIARDVAQAMVTFGCAHVCIWAEGASNGAH